jgi:hypothetical protein
VALDNRERLIENLALASALGFLALILAAASLAADARDLAAQRSALGPAASNAVLAARAADPSFDLIFRLSGGDSAAFAAVITLRSPMGAALVAATFSNRGELEELRLLGSCASRLPTEAQELATAFPDADEAFSRASDIVRALPSDQKERKS